MDTFRAIQTKQRQGDLQAAQDDADLACRCFSQRSPEWAWKFRLLEANGMVWRGLNEEVLRLLNEDIPANLTNPDLAIQKHMLVGLAAARQGRLDKADQELGEAERLSALPDRAISSELVSARGVLEKIRDRPASAEASFRRALQLARNEGDRFQEAAALVNLGAIAAMQEHYDQSIDWSNAAYRLYHAMNSSFFEEKITGNLGFAYSDLGDFDKSLALFQDAEKQARKIGVVRDQIIWLNNLGLVHFRLNQLSQAEDYYRQSLSLAEKTQDHAQIFDGLTSLSFIFVERGDLDLATQYSNRAFALARQDQDKGAELYPLLVQGRIAARQHDNEKARQIFQEVSGSARSDTSLRWEAEHDLAELYKNDHRPEAADRQYRKSLSIFETARSSLQNEDTRLPFLANATHLYDNYVHFLVERGKTIEALQVADFSRAQTLAEGLRILRKGTSFQPAKFSAQQIARRMGGTILFYWLGKQQSYLWVITSNRTTLFKLPPASEIDNAVRNYSKALLGPRDVLKTANADGARLYQMLVEPAQALIAKNSRVVVIADGSLNRLNFETMLVPKPALHYWIDDVTISNASSLRLLDSAGKNEIESHRLLLIGNPTASNPDYGELPKAAQEVVNVEKHFASPARLVLTRDRATPSAYLESGPERFSYIHLVAHGTASRLNPLDSAVVLSKATDQEDSFKLYARDIIRRPIDAELVTISTCFGEGSRAYTGEGLVGLSWAFLRAGAHNVVGSLWEVSDDSTPQLMDRLYAELEKGRRPDAALHAAKLSLLHSDSVFSKPFYWAPFQLYTRH